MTLPEIYDVGEVFTEVRAAHFPNQFVNHLLIQRALFINQNRTRSTFETSVFSLWMDGFHAEREKSELLASLLAPTPSVEG